MPYDCREATLVHGPTGTFVGEDELGNRYYENNKNQMGEQPSLHVLYGDYFDGDLLHALWIAGRHRWVVYKDLSWPQGQESTSIPPAWHGMRSMQR